MFMLWSSEWTKVLHHMIDIHTGFKDQKLLLNFLCEFSLQSCKSSNWMFGRPRLEVLCVALLVLLKFVFVMESCICCQFMLISVCNYEC